MSEMSSYGTKQSTVTANGRCERVADVIERLDFIFDSVVREPHELKHILSRNNLLILHWPLVKKPFLVRNKRKVGWKVLLKPIRRHSPVARKLIPSVRKDQN